MSEWSRRLASGASGPIDLDTEEGRAFLQERLAFFGGVGFLFQCGFFVLGRAALVLAAPALVTGPWTVAKPLMQLGDLGSQVLYLGLWAYARRGRRPPGMLRGADAALPFVTCTMAVVPLSGGGMASGAPFAALLITCLEKDPARRPQSAGELEESLLACSSASEWGEHEARLWWRSHARRVRELRARPSRGESSPMPTLAVSLEERLEEVRP